LPNKEFANIEEKIAVKQAKEQLVRFYQM